MRTNDLGGDHPANAASSSATAGTATAIMMSPAVLRHNLADHAEAAALQAAADAGVTPPPPPTNAMTALFSAQCC